MKQILFRAISKEPETTGQIIYGSIVNLSKPDKKPFYKMRDPDGKYSIIVQDSIRQYTGQQDKDSTPIFEGDIIQLQNSAQEFGKTYEVPVADLLIQNQQWKIIGNNYN